MEFMKKILATAVILVVATAANAGFLQDLTEKPLDTLKKETVDKVDINLNGRSPGGSNLGPCGGSPKVCETDPTGN